MISHFFVHARGRNLFHRGRRGFSLPELLIVAFVITIITGLALANYKTFTNDSLLSNTAYDVALTIRQTQLYGISVKESSPNSGQFQNAYGVHFVPGSTSYIIYQDVAQPLNYYYDSTKTGELVSTNNLPSGITISQVCSKIGSTITCDTANTALVDVEFVRPNPDANMSFKIPGSGSLSSPAYTAANYPSTLFGTCIYISSGTKTKNVYVDKTGQISVNSTVCP